MRVVIADASCLILFTNLGRLDILETLYREVWITAAVLAEYQLPIPAFISIHDPQRTDRDAVFFRTLDPGEATSIALALENPGCQIIIDEKKGRRVALDLGLDVTGTLGVLLKAASARLISADASLVAELDRHGFRLTEDLKDELLADS